MNLLQDREFKFKYQKCKYKVKMWESEFKKKHGKNPTKMDIKQAPIKIKDAYKDYYNMKTRMLESMDIFMSEEADYSFSENSEPRSEPLGSLKIGDVSDKVESQRVALADIQNCTDTSDPGNCISKKPFINDDDAQPAVSSENVWGAHLNKEKVLKKTEPLQRSFSSTYADKLAKACLSSTRNPRKSLTKLKRSRSSIYNTLSQDMPSQDSLSQGAISAKPMSISSSYESNTLSIDSLSCSLPISSSDLVNFSGDNPPSVSFNSSLQNLKLVTETKRVNNQPVSFIQKALSTSTTSLVKERSVDTGWLERCSQMTSLNNLSNINDNAVDISLSETNADLSRQDSTSTARNNSSGFFDDIGSDEDVIYSSDSENTQSRFSLKRKSSIFSSQSETSAGNVSKKLKLNDDDNSRSSSNVSETRPSQPSLLQQSSALAKPTESLPEPSKTNNFEELSQTKVEELADQIIEQKKALNRKEKTAGRKLTKKEVLEKKLASGQANDNFVRINLKKKVYVRGKKTMTFSKHKKLQWKANKKSAKLAEISETRGVMKCFKCGDVGHFARQCQGGGDKLMPQSDDEDDDCLFPTLEEAAAMASTSGIRSQSAVLPSTQSTSSQSDSAGGADSSRGVKIPAHVLEMLHQHDEKKIIEPVYDLKSDGSTVDPPKEVYDVLREFGHSEFRKGQCEAIMRILSGLSTLVTLSTGSGKSLCYQLPALMYSRRNNCITLVVSPLVSLMEDQIVGLPACLRAACLHRNLSEAQRSVVMESAKAGELDVLLVSPEAVMTGERSRGFGSIMKDLPPIAFACIDEAHCLSQWSDNFRPSYLMISEVLRKKLGVKTFLGLTATATTSTCKSIVSHLGIPDGTQGIIKDIPLPSNLILSVSRDRRRDDALLALLAGARFASCDSIIVYCLRRTECERVATLIRTCLEEGRRPEQKKIRCRVSTNAEPYHAGLTAARRRLVQKNFMSGKIRIVVATVAFGMGIDKRDIRGVIHYNMPKNFESYVQEVGRAGRDGLPAHCHLFLDPDGGDLNEIRRHIYANSVERHTIRKLLQRVFIPCRCNQLENLLETEKETPQNSSDSVKKEKVVCPGHEIAFNIEETVQALDLPEENIATMLCYLELHCKKWIKVLSPAYTMCKIQSYKGVKALKMAAKQSPPLAMAIALNQREGISQESSNKIEFPVINVASTLNWDSGVVKNHLKSLEWTNLAGRWRRTGICVELSVLGFRFVAPGKLSPEELDEALDLLYERVTKQEHKCLAQLQVAFEAFTNVAHTSCLECSDDMNEGTSDKLKAEIRAYFEQENFEVDLKLKDSLMHEDQVSSDVKQLVCSYPETTFTGRAVARVFHGIDSPCFPANIWGRCRFWRAHLKEDFKLVSKAATREILLMR